MKSTRIHELREQKERRESTAASRGKAVSDIGICIILINKGSSERESKARRKGLKCDQGFDSITSCTRAVFMYSRIVTIFPVSSEKMRIQQNLASFSSALLLPYPR
jgi:hypothetical protein